MNYWLDLFTWQTWQEFLDAGGNISGFNLTRWKTVQKMKRGDYLLCYMTGISRFFGILEVIGDPFVSEETIWSETVFPARIPVQVVMWLEPEYAIPVIELSDQLSYFQNMKSPNSWTGHFRGSPTRERQEDAQVIVDALMHAQQFPEMREYDQKKLNRKVSSVATSKGLVTVPDDNDENESDDQESVAVSHEEIQWLLLELGASMGLDLWVATNDKNKSFKNNHFSQFPNLRDSLPNQFDEATNRIIQLIDVLWLDKSAIVAAFEIEHTTSIYSGLLRMSDLITMQPNLDIKLYIVAPDERKEQAQRQINRPTFSQALRKPLWRVCRFIPYSVLQSSFHKYRDILRHISSDFLDDIAEELEPEDI